MSASCVSNNNKTIFKHYKDGGQRHGEGSSENLKRGDMKTGNRDVKKVGEVTSKIGRAGGVGGWVGGEHQKKIDVCGLPDWL